MWNVIIGEVRHEQQILSTTSIERFNADGRDARDLDFIVIVGRRHKNGGSKRRC
jgi:hypothetical protein